MLRLRVALFLVIALAAGCVIVPERQHGLVLEADGSVVQRQMSCEGLADRRAPAAAALDPRTVRIASWNLHKQSDPGWEAELGRLIAASDVLLLGGTLTALDHKTWTYKTAGASTPIVQLSDQPRMSIAWNMDDPRMLTHQELAALVGAQGVYRIVVRLRESNSIELQQCMLADRSGLCRKIASEPSSSCRQQACRRLWLARSANEPR